MIYSENKNQFYKSHYCKSTITERTVSVNKEKKSVMNNRKVLVSDKSDNM